MAGAKRRCPARTIWSEEADGMRTSVWLGPWDWVEGGVDRLLDQLQSMGLDRLRIACAYHGGRLLLPRSPRGRVFELPQSGCYFEAGGFGAIKPEMAPADLRVEEFAARAARRGFEVAAWLVCCHNDVLPSKYPQAAMRNAFGEASKHGLCPSQPDVREYVVALASAAQRIEGVSSLDLEAVGFLGYGHGSLHDKCGVELSAAGQEALSVCFCESCRGLMGGEAERSARWCREAVDRAVNGGEVCWPKALRGMVEELRRGVLTRLLDSIPAARDVRFAPDLWHTGGKTGLERKDLGGRAEMVTVTFFGAREETMGAARFAGLAAGFMFHAPDCRDRDAVLRRTAIARRGGASEVSFYSWSLACEHQLAWLKEAVSFAKEPL